MAANRRTRKHVGISGSYGGLNLGDEAILKVIVTELRRALPVDITVFTRDAENTRRCQDVDHVVQVRDVARNEALQAIGSLDLFILGGGGILYDAEAEIYLREVVLAHEAGVPVMVYAVSAGPLKDRSVRARVREALNAAAAITVRDRQTLQLFEEIGVQKEITLTADPAVLLEPEPLDKGDTPLSEAVDLDARLIGLSVRELGPAAPDIDIEHYHRLVANAADFLIDRFEAEVVFFPLERRMFDVQHSHGVVAQMSHAQQATVLKREYSPGQLVTLLRHFDFTVGMRLHFLIFSAIAGVPFMGLPYATKISGFLDELRLETLGLGNISAGQLIARIDRAWGMRDELRTRISTALKDMQHRARENNAAAVRLLSPQPAGAAEPPVPSPPAAKEDR